MDRMDISDDDIIQCILNEDIIDPEIWCDSEDDDEINPYDQIDLFLNQSVNDSNYSSNHFDLDLLDTVCIFYSKKYEHKYKYFIF